MTEKTASVFAAAALAASFALAARAADPARGPLRIGFSPGAPDFVQQAAERIYKAAASNAVAKALAPDGKVEFGAIDFSEPAEKVAFSHIIAVGMPDDPLVTRPRRLLAKFTPVADDSPKAAKWKMYAFGYGGFGGHVGWIESGANPVMHSSRVPRVPFETEMVTITGTGADGIDAAAEAFLSDCLVNGIVARGGAWSRDGETLLDRDPLEPGKLPATGFEPPEGWTLAGRTDCPSDVLRGVLEATRKRPVRAVLEKFTRQGELDGAGAENAHKVYLNGLDRHAYGNAALTLFFEDEPAARMAAKRLESNRRILASQEASGDGDTTLRPVKVAQEGVKVVLSTLP